MRHLSWLVATTLLAGVPTAQEDWQPCPENPGTTCTTVNVPVDWAQPGGERLDIAVARRPATGTRTGTLVYLPAGPGSSGVDAVTNYQIFGLLFPRVAEHFDVVSFDPRGVRRSHAVECDADLVARLDRPTPTDQHQFDELLAVQAEVGADAEQGRLYDGTRMVDPAELTYRVVSPLTRPDLPAVAREIARPGATASLRATTPLPIYLQCADNRNSTTSFAHAARLRAQSRAVAPDVRGSAFDIADLCINPPVPATNPQRPSACTARPRSWC